MFSRYPFPLWPAKTGLLGRICSVYLAASILPADQVWAQTESGLQSVPFTAVELDDTFWQPRLETNRRVTVGYDLEKCEQTGRLANFTKAAGRMPGDFEGIYFNDSDVYKVIEGIAYTLAQHPDPELEARLDRLIDDIAAAQEKDGYLYTIRTIQPDRVQQACGKTRWSHLAHSHELYNVGHLYEAAVAHYQATGKRTLLEVAIRSADLIDRTFGPNDDQRIDVPGHEEIEIGLIRLYQATDQPRYLKLAQFFLDHRGQAAGRERLYGPYHQDHMPVTEQSTAVGHAVRAVYLYIAMADMARLTGNEKYAEAVKRIWRDVVSTKLYLTGGIGARHEGETFGEAYELPNDTAYNETCAAIAQCLWNHRMFLEAGDARYLDVLERTLYNGFLSGIALEGNKFFYPNPLASDGKQPFNKGVCERSPWFDCSCCPVNIVRFMPSIASFIYATRADSLYVNLYVAGSGTIRLQDKSVTIQQKTDYPWQGKITLRVDPDQPQAFTLRLRIPGWAQGKPVPSELYTYLTRPAGSSQGAESGEPSAKSKKLNPALKSITLQVNGKVVTPEMQHGFAVIQRTWQPGDTVQLDLPMPVRRVLANEKVEADRGRVALERGPLVYCVEGIDHQGRVSNLVLPDAALLTARHRPDLLGGITVLEGQGLRALERGGQGTATDSKDTGKTASQPVSLTAIPYYSWNHRGAGEMAVWLLREIQ